MKLITADEALAFHAERRRLGDAVTWTITKRDHDYVARPGCTMPWAPALILQHSTLDGLRRKLPPGLSHYPGDETTVEVWI